MNRFKRVSMAMLSGMMVAIALVSIYVPKFLTWYFEPPSNIGISCAPAIDWAFHRLQILQLAGLGIGAVCGFLIGLQFTKNRSDKVE